MSGRNAILNKLRTQIGGGDSGARRAAVAARLSQHPDGVIPARGHLEGRKRTALFCQMAEKVSASVQRVRRQESIPRAVADYLEHERQEVEEITDVLRAHTPFRRGERE